MNWWLIYGSALVGAVVSTVIAVLVFRRLSWKLDFVDHPMSQGHKRHGDATPLLGGAAMIVSWSIVCLTGTWMALRLESRLPRWITVYTSGLDKRTGLLLVIIGGGVVLGIIGLIDDKRPMGWKLKLACQAAVCAVVTYSDQLQITVFQLNPVVTWTLSFCWFMFIINAFNFFDNMDGLAAGVAFIVSLLFGIVAALRGQQFVAVLGAATAGTTMGYYLFNRAPASIFMGDCGSHFLGYLLAVQGALTTFYRDAESPTLAPLFIPVIVLSPVIYDTFAVTFVRLRQGRSIFAGDHNHISHRFVRMGYSRRTAVLLVHVITLTLGLGALALMFLPPTGAIIIFMQTGAVLTLISLIHGSHSSNGKG